MLSEIPEEYLKFIEWYKKNIPDKNQLKKNFEKHRKELLEIDNEKGDLNESE